MIHRHRELSDRADLGAGMRVHKRNLPRALALLAWLALLVAYVLFAARMGESAEAKGKISKNFYRIPYEDGSSVKITNDYVGHGNSPAGNAGPMDMVALPIKAHVCRWCPTARGNADGICTGKCAAPKRSVDRAGVRALSARSA